MTQTQILFKVKLQGCFTRDGFTPLKDVKPMTITKFTDGTFMVKAGRKTLIHRGNNRKLESLLLGSLGVSL